MVIATAFPICSGSLTSAAAGRQRFPVVLLSLSADSFKSLCAVQLPISPAEPQRSEKGVGKYLLPSDDHGVDTESHHLFDDLVADPTSAWWVLEPGSVPEGERERRGRRTTGTEEDLVGE